MWVNLNKHWLQKQLKKKVKEKTLSKNHTVDVKNVVELYHYTILWNMEYDQNYNIIRPLYYSREE